MTTRGRNAEEDLPGIVDPPLETSECTDHEDTGAETDPHALPAQLLADGDDGAALSVVELGDDGIGGVGDDGTEDTSDVTGEEGDHELGSLGVGVTRLLEGVSVEHGDNVLEEGELDHGVGDLSAPERDETLVEAVETLSAGDTLDGGHQLGGVVGFSGGCLDTDLDGFHRTQADISEELGGGGGGEVEGVLVLVGLIITNELGVGILEDLVETELAEALHAVTDHGRLPALEDTVAVKTGLDALLETVPEGGVETGGGLHSALDEIEGGDG